MTPATEISVDPRVAARHRAEWDAVMSGFLPGAGGFEAVLFRAAEAVCGGPPRAVLDLGGGPGGLAGRMHRRWPAATVALLDCDPVLLALARAGLSGAVPVLDGDLSGPDWLAAAAAHGPFDVVTVVMTLHYLPAARVRAFYRDARRALAPGGLLVVADVMPDDGIPTVMDAPPPDAEAAAAERAWTRWWARVAADPAFGPLLRRRATVFGDRPPAEFTGTADWHRDAARAAGFTEAGVLWRGGRHAALGLVAGPVTAPAPGPPAPPRPPGTAARRPGA